MARTTDPVLIDSTDGVRVALHDLGGDGPALLLVHATGFHGRVWGPVASHLSDFHCYAPDLRGHGDSVVPDGLTYEWHGFGDDVLAVIGALELHHVLAAGHSKGGAALLLAEQKQPGTFRSLYLFEPIVFPPIGGLHPADQENPLAAGARRRRAVFDSYDAAYDNFAAKPPLAILHPDALRAYVDGGFALLPDGTVTLKCRPEVEAEVYSMGAQHGAFGHLGEVQTPVTVAIGEEAPFSPAAFGAPIVAALPHGRIEEHPELGHFGPLQDPATIAACIRAAVTGE
jgi:pimeloyl-ACP methyl ester carboxylesterase